jgi:multicomponent Na+:H+ antiporter subunit D
MTAMAELFLPLNPGIVLILAGIVAAALPANAGRWFVIAAPLVMLGYLFGVDLGTHAPIAFLDYQLETFRLDALARVFGTIFLISVFLCNVFAMGDSVDRTQRAAGQIYGGSAVAAVFAGDTITLFVFFELAAVASVFLIWARGTERAYRAGMRYLIIQITAGVILLSGVLVHVAGTGSIAFDHLGLDTPGGGLILLAFAIKCAFPLLHNWLQDAYPQATVSGTVILSAFTTKMAIYALARSYAGTEMLIWMGALMAVFPILFAIVENDLRRVLAYSLNHQLGFMVVGIGIGTELALNGAISHAFASVLYQGLLFMTMGAVLFRAGTVNASELGGLYKSMPWTAGFCLVGAASISSMPLLAGFVTKSMTLTATAGEGYWFVWLALVLASAGAFLHSGIKVPYFAFFGADSGKRPKEAPLPMLVAMGLTSALCLGIGVYPQALYALLPFPVEYVAYSTYHVINQLQLLAFAALAVVILMLAGAYPANFRSINLDTDWFYRRAAKAVFLAIGRLIDRAYGWATSALIRLIGVFISLCRGEFGPLGTMGGTTRVGSGVAWISALLLLGLIVAYGAS